MPPETTAQCRQKPRPNVARICTVRRFVTKLREKHGITKVPEPRREYEAVDELPKGHQLQLDFGEKKVREASCLRYSKLYFVVFTLTYSRYKWGMFQAHPFTSSDLVLALYLCFLKLTVGARGLCNYLIGRQFLLITAR